MTATTAPSPVPTPGMTLGGVARAFVRWLRANAVTAVVSAGVGTITGFVTNVWLVAVYYQGTNQAQAAGHNAATGALLSGLATTVFFGLFGHYRAVGGARFGQDLRNLPSALISLLTRDGTAGRIHLLWGAAVSIMVTQLISPGVGAVLAIGLLASLPGIVGRVISTLVIRAWQQVLQRVAPTRAHRPVPVLSMSVGILGGSLAMLAGYLLPASANIGGGYYGGGIPTRPVIAVGLGILAFALSRGASGAGPALKALLLVAGGLALAELLHPLLAWASDGGYLECGNPDIAKLLTQCQGHEGVVVDAAAGAAGAALGGPVGTFLGSGGAGDDGGGGGDGDWPPGIPPRPPAPHFPHVFVKGGSVMIETANGVTLSASLRPDGTLGPWSASNPRSGGDVTNRITNPDGTVTTNYSDGTAVIQGPDGVQSWGPDGTYTVTGPDGSASTTHPDGSVDVRNPDGSSSVTRPDGSRTETAADGTATTTSGDGTVVVHHPDGSATSTSPDGTVVQQGSDGTVVTTAPDGGQVVVNADGTTTKIAPDGATETRWPDGSTRTEAADGTMTTTGPNGEVTQHRPDGGYTERGADGSVMTRDADGTTTTQNPDGSQVVRSPDGTVSTRDPSGVEVTHFTDGSVDTTYPNGVTVSHNPDGTMSARGPDGRDLGDPGALLHDLDVRSGYMNDHPDIYAAVKELQAQVAAHGGGWTPAELATLMALQGKADAYSDQRHADIVADQARATDEWNAWRKDQQARQDAQAAVAAAMTKGSDFVLNHLKDLPPDQAQHIRDALAQVNTTAPTQQDLDRVRQIIGTTFRLNGVQNATDAANAKLDAAQADANMGAASKVSTSMAVLEGVLLLPYGAASGVAGRLGGFYLGRNFVQGAGVSLAENGLNFNGVTHAVTDGVRSTLPINTAIATGRAIAGQGSVSEVGWSLVRDVGNMMALQGAGVKSIGGDGGVNFFGRSDGSGLFGTGLFGAKAPAPPDPLWQPEVQSVHDPSLSPAGATPGRDAATGLRVGASSRDVLGPSSTDRFGGKATMADVEGWKAPAAAPAPGAEPGGPPPRGSEPITTAPQGEATAPSSEHQPAGLDDTPKGRGATAADNADFYANKQNAQQAVEDWKALHEKAVNDPTPENLQAVSAKTAEINSSNTAKGIMKELPPDLQADFVDMSQDHIVASTHDAVGDLNAQGYQRGGRPLDAEKDFWQVRNATNSGVKGVGMDLDLATTQQRQVALQNALDHAVPGSSEAQQLQHELLQVKAENSFSRIDPATGARVSVSDAEFRDAMQQSFGDAYHANTGQDAVKSNMGITDYQHHEAYRDPNPLVNRPDLVPFASQHADQTGSVTSTKMNDMFDKVAEGHLTYSEALVESARGTAKDITTKLEPMLIAYNADPAAIVRVQEMKSFLTDVGRGVIPPTDAQRMSQRLFGTDIQGLVMQADAGISTATKFGPAPDPWLHNAAGAATSSGTAIAQAMHSQRELR